jgi:hypothetical protein
VDSAGSTERSNTRVQRNGFVADILISHSPKGDIYHYIIVREGSREILHGGQEVSMQRALECIEDFLGQYDRGIRKQA